MRNPFNNLTPRYSPLAFKPHSPFSRLPNPSTLLSVLVVAGLSFFLGRHTAPSDSLLTIPCPYRALSFPPETIITTPYPPLDQ